MTVNDLLKSVAKRMNHSDLHLTLNERVKDKSVQQASDAIERLAQPKKVPGQTEDVK
jgi:hypothetical protein